MSSRVETQVNQILADMAAEQDTLDDATDYLTAIAETYIPLHAEFLGLQYSIYDQCLENYYDCYAEIGGVDWLPAYTYLPSNATVSVQFYNYGICKPDSPPDVNPPCCAPAKAPPVKPGWRILPPWPTRRCLIISPPLPTMCWLRPDASRLRKQSIALQATAAGR